MRKEVKIGLFAFVMLLLLFWGINFLKGRNIFSTSNTFYTTFESVDGLNVAGDVMFRGIKVGTITEIDFDPAAPEGITVEFTVARRYPLPNDSHITTLNPYIIGGKVMAIEYGRSPEMFRSGDTIPSLVKPELLGQITDNLEPIRERVVELMNGLSRTLDGLQGVLSEENIRSLSGTFSNVERLTGGLQSSVDNVNALTETLRNNGANIDRILTNTAELSDSLRALRLAETLGNLNATLAELNAVAEKANTGDGSLALLLNDPSLYEGLQASSESLNALLEDLKAHPGRYVHFSLFGKKDK